MVAVVMASRHGHATVVLECPETCQGSEFGKAEAVTLKYSYPVSLTFDCRDCVGGVEVSRRWDGWRSTVQKPDRNQSCVNQRLSTLLV